MDRLTKRINGGIERICHHGLDGTIQCYACRHRTQCNAAIFERLAEYEDTGYMPEDLVMHDNQSSNEPLTIDELRQMVGEWVWVDVKYPHFQCNGWALVMPKHLAYLDQMLPIDFFGHKFIAYRNRPKNSGSW